MLVCACKKMDKKARKRNHDFFSMDFSNFRSPSPMENKGNFSYIGFVYLSPRNVIHHFPPLPFHLSLNPPSELQLNEQKKSKNKFRKIEEVEEPEKSELYELMVLQTVHGVYILLFVRER